MGQSSAGADHIQLPAQLHAVFMRTGALNGARALPHAKLVGLMAATQAPQGEL